MLFQFSRKERGRGKKSNRPFNCKPNLEVLEDRCLLSVAAGPIVNPANGHTYYLLAPSTWTAAENEAISLGGHLASINDAAENQWVLDTFKNEDQYGLWIGLYDAAGNGNFVWSSGDPVSYTNWLPDQPDWAHEDWVHMWVPTAGFAYTPGKWNNYRDEATAEYPAKVYVLQGVVEVAVPKVVNIVTHGFNPLQNWQVFLSDFQELGNALENIPSDSSALDGKVKSYVSEWDSSSGWIGAFTSVGAAFLLPQPLSSMALVSAQLFMNKAGQLAAQAALDVVDAVTTLPDYLGDPSAGQIIHLVGHSRGAAVNARVSDLLTQKGYVVDQYTALDGYSTDWPDLGGILGDISITGEAKEL